MEEITNLGKGVLLGLSVAAPVGPIGVLCIRRTLEGGMARGLATGLGAATADMCYGATAAVGISAVTHTLISLQGWLHVAGGLFLGWLGLTTILSQPAASAAAAQERRGLWGAYLSTVTLTLANPSTILSFIAIFASISLGGHGVGQTIALVLGIFSGSALWWVVLSGTIHMVRQRLPVTLLLWVNRLSGLILIGFALWAIGSVGR